jgi:multiple sugar transport system substrate-binding protein
LNLGFYLDLDPDFDKESCMQNILEALRYRGGVWFMPLNYYFNYFTYDSVLTPSHIAQGFGIDKSFSAQELLNTGIPLFDGSNLIFNNTGGLGDMFSILLNENYQSYVDLEKGRANFDNGGFASLLESINYFTDQGYIRKGYSSADIEEILSRMMESPSERIYFKQKNSYFLINMFLQELTQNMNTGFSGGNIAAIEDDDKIAGIQANAGGSVPFSYNLGFGINSSSKNKQTAWAFIKFLLSKETQMSPYIFNYPVNNEARYEKYQQEFKMALGIFEGDLNGRQLSAMNNYIQTVENLSAQIDTYVIADSNINDMIAQEVMQFFEGVRNAQETTRVLQSKADLYLSE